MTLGLLGVGHQGQKFIRTCEKLGLKLEWTSNKPRFDADAIIIATPAETHYELAKEAISRGKSVLIEKPMTMDVGEAEELYALALEKGVTGFVDHTHLYSPAWRAFKAKTEHSLSGVFVAGGPCKTDTRWDWGSHGAAMALDLGVIPVLEIRPERTHVSFTAGGWVYDDPPTDPQPHEVLLTEFLEALGKADVSGIRMGLNVARMLQ